MENNVENIAERNTVVPRLDVNKPISLTYQ